MSPKYSTEPSDPQEYSRGFDQFYSTFAPIYSLLVDLFPIWRSWINHALPHLSGPKVLEVSFGTGHLLAEYSHDYNSFGIDLNRRMAKQAAGRLAKIGYSAQLQMAKVDHIPYASATFNTVVSTMAFSGYPNGERALREMRRVLKPSGVLVMVDVNYPGDRNPIGMGLARFWQAAGDLIRDVPALFDDIGWRCQDIEIGGFGSVHLYLAQR